MFKSIAVNNNAVSPNQSSQQQSNHGQICSNLIRSKPSQCNFLCWSRINQNSSKNFHQTWPKDRENVHLYSVVKPVLNSSQIPQNASFLEPENAAWWDRPPPRKSNSKGSCWHLVNAGQTSTTEKSTSQRWSRYFRISSFLLYWICPP